MQGKAKAEPLCSFPQNNLEFLKQQMEIATCNPLIDLNVGSVQNTLSLYKWKIHLATLSVLHGTKDKVHT